MLEANRLRYLKTQQENLLKRMQKEKESGANRMLRWVREKTDAVLMVIVIAIYLLIKLCKEGKNFSTSMINPED